MCSAAPSFHTHLAVFPRVCQFQPVEVAACSSQERQAHIDAGSLTLQQLVGLLHSVSVPPLQPPLPPLPPLHHHHHQQQQQSMASPYVGFDGGASAAGFWPVADGGSGSYPLQQPHPHSGQPPLPRQFYDASLFSGQSPLAGGGQPRQPHNPFDFQGLHGFQGARGGGYSSFGGQDEFRGLDHTLSLSGPSLPASAAAAAAAAGFPPTMPRGGSFPGFPGHHMMQQRAHGYGYGRTSPPPPALTYEQLVQAAERDQRKLQQQRQQHQQPQQQQQQPQQQQSQQQQPFPGTGPSFPLSGGGGASGTSTPLGPLSWPSSRATTPAQSCASTPVPGPSNAGGGGASLFFAAAAPPGPPPSGWLAPFSGIGGGGVVVGGPAKDSPVAADSPGTPDRPAPTAGRQGSQGSQGSPGGPSSPPQLAAARADAASPLAAHRSLASPSLNLDELRVCLS